jgi:hypothetical protein
MSHDAVSSVGRVRAPRISPDRPPRRGVTSDRTTSGTVAGGSISLNSADVIADTDRRLQALHDTTTHTTAGR